MVILRERRIANQLAEILFMVLLALTRTSDGYPAEVKHPNLLINQRELEELREKTKRQPWKRVFEQVKQIADNSSRGAYYEAGLCYALTGEKKYLNKTKKALLHESERFMEQSPDSRLKESNYYHEGPRFGGAEYGYDFIYQGLTREERKKIETWLRTACEEAMVYAKTRSTNPSMKGAQCGEIGRKGCVLGDDRIIRWAIDYYKSDAILGRFRDTGVWVEPQTYTQIIVCALTSFAESLYRYDGTDLFKFESDKGISLKSIIDSQIAIAYPGENTGIGKGSIRVLSFGHGCTRNPSLLGKEDYFLVNGTMPVAARKEAGTWYGVLEVLYRRTRDPAYAWFLSQSTTRDERTLQLGFTFLTHGQLFETETLSPPRAPSGVFPEIGYAFLRGNESPAYWTGRALAAYLQIHNRYFHRNRGQDFQLILHGSGRLLHPEYLLSQYERPPYKWTEHPLGHNTVMVDERHFLEAHEEEREEPAARYEFHDLSKFVVASGSTARDVEQSRALIMTKEYLLDLFSLKSKSSAPHTYDWLLHGFGNLSVSGGGEFTATKDMTKLRWFTDVQKRTTANAWSAVWTQQSAGVIRGVDRRGPEWFNDAVVSRLIMSGEPETTIYAGNGPRTVPPYGYEEGNPEGAIPTILVRRQAADTVYCAVHEAYREEDGPKIKAVSKLAEGPAGVVVAVEGPDYSDRLISTFGKDDTETVLQWQEVGSKNRNPRAKTIAPDEANRLRKTIVLQSQTDPHELFRVKNYGFVRFQGDKIIAEGGIEGFSIRAPTIASTGAFTLNGKQVEYRKLGDYCIYKVDIAISNVKPAIVQTADELHKDVLEISRHESRQRPREVVIREDYPDQKVTSPYKHEQFPGFEDGFRDYIVEAPGYTVRINRNLGVVARLLDPSGNLWTGRRQGYFRRNPIKIGALFDWWGEKVVKENRERNRLTFTLASGVQLQYEFALDHFEFTILDKNGVSFTGKLKGGDKLFCTVGSTLTWGDGERLEVLTMGIQRGQRTSRGGGYLYQIPAFADYSLHVDGPTREQSAELYGGLSIMNYLGEGQKRWRISFLDQHHTRQWLEEHQSAEDRMSALVRKPKGENVVQNGEFDEDRGWQFTSDTKWNREEGASNRDRTHAGRFGCAELTKTGRPVSQNGIALLARKQTILAFKFRTAASKGFLDIQLEDPQRDGRFDWSEVVVVADSDDDGGVALEPSGPYHWNTAHRRGIRVNFRNPISDWAPVTMSFTVKEAAHPLLLRFITGMDRNATEQRVWIDDVAIQQME